MFLITITTTHKLHAIKAIREVSDCGLKTSKDMVERGIIAADANELSAVFNTLQAAWCSTDPDYRFAWGVKDYCQASPVSWVDRFAS